MLLLLDLPALPAPAALCYFNIFPRFFLHFLFCSYFNFIPIFLNLFSYCFPISYKRLSHIYFLFFSYFWKSWFL